MSTKLPQSPHFTIQPLAEGVWAAMHHQGGAAICNAGIVDLGDGTMVFDTFSTPTAAAELRSAAEQLTNKPILYALNSHWHLDHLLGNQQFADVTIISGAGTAELLTTKGASHLQALRDDVEAQARTHQHRLAAARDDVEREHIAAQTGIEYIQADLPHLRLVLPQRAIDKLDPPLDLAAAAAHASFGEGRATLYNLDGHTISDLVLLLPAAGIAFVADLVGVHTHPSMWNCYPQSWLRTLETLAQMQLRIIVPGHGPLGSSEDIHRTADYLNTMLDLAQGVVSAGGSEDEAAATTIPTAFADWQDTIQFSYNMRYLHQYLMAQH